MKKNHDIVVIGSGPGGYVAAVRAAKLGQDTACVELDTNLGGTCLQVGCIPTKALLESSARYHAAREELAGHGVVASDVSLDLTRMMARKDEIVAGLGRDVGSLFSENKVSRYRGHGRLSADGTVLVDGEEPCEIVARHVIIATGSRPIIPRGMERQGDRIGDSTDALAYPEVPERLVVIGAGAIGLELGMVWSRLGSKVTVLEFLDRILPGTDAEIARLARKSFEEQGIEMRLGVRVARAGVEGDRCVVEIEGADPVEADRVLVAVGRAPNTGDLGLDVAGVEIDDRGGILVDGAFATNRPGIYAIGDAIGGPLLAHKATHEALACVEKIVKGYGHVRYDTIPGVVYTEPEVASVGHTEEELRAAGVPFKRGKFKYKGNGRALALGSDDGRIKVLAHSETDRVLGVHAIGPRAGDMIAEAAAAMEFGASSEDIARVCHPHPTLSEVLGEAARAVTDRPIHS